MYRINPFWRRVGHITITTVFISVLWILEFYLISVQVSPHLRGKNTDRTAVVKENLSAIINFIPQELTEICLILPSASC
ncbi:MAG: hypothetical protein VKK42_03235 [Lyngbya sp.]|nr:hypothetical protein [Lyngbya sp.]